MSKGKNMQSMTRDEIIKAVGCAACGACAGQPCKEKKGHGGMRIRSRVHPCRAKLATGGKFNNKRPKRSMPKQVVSKDFYQGWAWKEARFAAIKTHGRRCQCCGWSPGDTQSGYLVVDHIKPVRTHPHLALEPNNHQVLCNDCNMGKSYKHTDDFR